MKKKIVLITSNEIRHEYFRKFLNKNKSVEIIKCLVEKKLNKKYPRYKSSIKQHFKDRNLNEKEHFYKFTQNNEEPKNLKFLKKNEINLNKKLVYEIVKDKPDFIISYGCSIIRNNLINIFKKKFINIHLGLSPYYRGSGTNIWPIINNEMQFIGTTFMFIDKGIDTGKIIHQIRADIKKNDNLHLIGNRLIKKTFKEIIKIIFNLKKRTYGKINYNYKKKYYKKKDFDENKVLELKSNFKKNLNMYLKNQNKLKSKYPIKYKRI